MIVALIHLPRANSGMKDFLNSRCIPLMASMSDVQHGLEYRARYPWCDIMFNIYHVCHDCTMKYIGLVFTIGNISTHDINMF